MSLYFNLDFHKRRPLLSQLKDAPRALLRQAQGKSSAERRFWALQNVSLSVREGDVYGIIGRNGAGKSTLLRVLAGILTPDQGHVTHRGEIGALLSLAAGFQSVLTGRENIFLRGVVLGFTKRQIAERVDEIIAFSGLDRFIDAPVRSYSSGMRARLGFSIAVHFDPSILLLDEVMGAGDAAFKKRSGNLFERFLDERRTIVLCTHNMSQILENCNRAMWLDKGVVVQDGEVNEVVEAYVASTEGNKSHR